MPILCSTECARTSLRVPSEPSSLTRNFGTRNSEMPFGAGRRIGQARQHEMDDVVGQVVLAIGDEDLRAGDAIGAVAARSALRVRSAPTSEPACGSVSCMVPIHSPRDQLLEIDLLQLVAAVARPAPRSPAMVSTGPMPKAIEAAFHISMQAAFSACGRPWPPKSAGRREPVPAAVRPRRV